MSSTPLLTDRYELTMLDATLRDGTASRPSVFEMFARRLPSGRRYGVAAGLGRLLDVLGEFVFDDGVLGFLDDEDVVGPATLKWLAEYRFTGEIHAYREGEPYFPGSPVLTVTAPFGEALVLETLALSIFNHDSAIASAAARMVSAAEGRGLMEFGSRRAHEEAAVAAARAAYVAGFDGTSNLEAGRRYGLPTLGTSAHAYTLIHDDELAAFRAQVEALGHSTTLLVDTYDTRTGIDHALMAAGPTLGSVRIDSGDLAAEAERARKRLDAAGASGARIVLSGDLDEHKIARLRTAPADSYGVGTAVVTGSGAPTAEFVYKLVARAEQPDAPLLPVAKAGGNKATTGGRKAAARHLSHGVATGELIRAWGEPCPDGGRPLQLPVVVDGEVLHDPGLDEVREHHRDAMRELPEAALSLDPGEPCLPTLQQSATLAPLLSST